MAARSDTGIGSENATCTRRGIGRPARKSFSVPGDRARHERGAGLEREPAGAAARVAELVRVAHAGALGEEREQAALAQDRAGGLEGVGVGLAAPHGEGAEPHQQARRSGASISSVFAMKRRWRRVQTPMKNESQKLLWLGAMIAAPSAGMCSAPDTCMRKYRRNSGATMPRTSAYSQRETPFSRASRLASSLLTEPGRYRRFGRQRPGYEPST